MPMSSSLGRLLLVVPGSPPEGVWTYPSTLPYRYDPCNENRQSGSSDCCARAGVAANDAATTMTAKTKARPKPADVFICTKFGTKTEARMKAAQLPESPAAPAAAGLAKRAG